MKIAIFEHASLSRRTKVESDRMALNRSTTVQHPCPIHLGRNMQDDNAPEAIHHLRKACTLFLVLNRPRCINAKFERSSVEKAKSIFHITSKGDEGIERHVPRHKRVGRRGRRGYRQNCTEQIGWDGLHTYGLRILLEGMSVPEQKSQDDLKP